MVLHVIQEDLVHGVGDAPRQYCSSEVASHALVELAHVPVAGLVYDAERGEDAGKGATHLRLHVRLDHIERVEHCWEHGTKQATVDKVVETVLELVVRAREHLLERIAQGEEERVRETVSHTDGAQAAVQLSRSMWLGDGFEDVPGVTVVAVVLLHLEESLYALEWGQDGLG